MADVLTVLREYNVSKKDILEQDDLVVFGDKAWSKTAKTNYVAYGSGTDTVPKEYYTVDCILFLLKNVHYPHAMYVRQAAQANVPVVRRPDRKDLLSYLNGETATSQSIDKSATLEISQTAPKSKEASKRPSEPAPSGEAKRQRFETGQVQRDKEMLAAKLDGLTKPTAGPVTQEPGEKSTLPATLTKEKIAAIKAKVALTKRSKINIEDEPGGFELGSFVDSEVAITQDIISRERRWRSRSTVLQSNGKQFAQNIFGILTSIKAREEGRQSNQPTPARTTVPNPLNRTTAQTTYNRYAQESFKQKEETDEFQIDVTKTFQGTSLKSAAEPGAKKPAAPTPRVVTEQPQGNKRTSRTPIIIIPAATTSVIQMINAKDILQDLKFVSAPQKKAEGAVRDNEVLIQRKKGETTVPYRVIDNIMKLSPHDWDRVVAVFAQGPAWQFKSWPWGGNPVEIFSKMKAFHITLRDLPTEANIAKWDVTKFVLDPHKRHLDRATLQTFWEVLDRFCAKNKSHLRI